MKNALLMLLVFMPMLAFSQSITTQSKKKIGKYKSITLERSVLNTSDTSYYLYFKNPEYQYIIDLVFISMSKSELIELANGIKTVDSIKYDEENKVIISLSNNIMLSKMKVMGYWLTLCDPKNRCINIPLDYGRDMQYDIYDEIGLGDKYRHE